MSLDDDMSLEDDIPEDEVSIRDASAVTATVIHVNLTVLSVTIFQVTE